MPDILGWSSDWLESQRKELRTRLVIYRRGEASCEVLATPGRTEYERRTADGFVFKVETHDWLITAADLHFAGVAIEPERHDQIDDTDPESGTVFTYSVLPLEKSNCWRYSDQNRRTYRIHSKLISKSSTEAEADG